MYYRQCPHCQATFRASAVEPPKATRCPRCNRKIDDGHHKAAKLTASDLARDRRCVICDCVLSVHQVARQLCHRPACKQARSRQIMRKEKQRQLRLRREKVGRMLRLLQSSDRLVKSIGPENPQQYLLAILPANTWSLAPLPESRRSELAKNLRAVVERVLLEEETADANLWTPYGGLREPVAEPDPDEQAVLGNACATCRGWCCQGGGEHAYIDEATIHAHMMAHPDQDGDAIVADYLSYVPEVTYEGSCVYHTRQGCALPRKMRSAMGRSFYCQGLKELGEQIPLAGVRQVLAGAFDEEKLVRIAIISKFPTSWVIVKKYNIEA